jgi:S1-C subfamily serine protease
MNDSLKRVIIIILIIGLGLSLYATTQFISAFVEKGGLTGALEEFDLSLPGLTEKIVTRQEVIEEESAVIELVEDTSNSVVSVVERSVVFDLFTGPSLEEGTIGTGFAVDTNKIITNRHVVSVANATYIIVDNEGNEYEVANIVRDDFNDLALIEVQDGNFTALKLGDSGNIKVGQTVVAIGNALGRFTNTVTKGVISGIGRGITASSGFGSFQRLDNVIQTDAALNPGNSGGPLFNLSGEVIAVNVAVGQGSENIGFAIPINAAKELISDIENGVVRTRGYLGVRYQMIDERIANLRDLVEGAFIEEVIADSPAEEAGLQPGDIVMSINDEPLTIENDLRAETLNYKAGEEVTLQVWRAGKEIELQVTLGALE